MREEGPQNAVGQMLVTELPVPEYMPLNAILHAFHANDKVTGRVYRSLAQTLRPYAVAKAEGRDDFEFVDFDGNRVKMIGWETRNLYSVMWAADHLYGRVVDTRLKFTKQDKDREERQKKTAKRKRKEDER